MQNHIFLSSLLSARGKIGNKKEDNMNRIHASRDLFPKLSPRSYPDIQVVTKEHHQLSFVVE